MARLDVREIECKSLINKVQGMPFGWSINPYRGCSHACHYCYARVTHTYLDLGVGDDFSRILFAKVNAPAVARRELARRTWRRELVAIGTGTDPYQPIEGKYRLTRGILQALADYRTPASITTKSTLVVRDADVLQQLTRAAGTAVYFSVASLDDAVWRRLEPGTPSPRQRLRVLEQLARAGIRAGVLLAPVIPGVSDSSESLQAVMQAARDAGAAFCHPIILRLENGVKGYFFDVMSEQYPETARGYGWLFRGTDAPRPYVAQVERRAAALLARVGYVPADSLAGPGGDCPPDAGETGPAADGSPGGTRGPDPPAAGPQGPIQLTLAL